MAEDYFIEICKWGKDFPYMDTIDLQNNQISDQGLKVFVENGKKFSNLQKVNLKQNKITDVGFKVFAENG